MKIRSIKIEDPIELHKTGAIEVTVFTSTGERRWCFFFTPEGMSSCGNFIEGTSVRFHYGASHMILVSEISHIESALKDIERWNWVMYKTLLIANEHNKKNQADTLRPWKMPLNISVRR